MRLNLADYVSFSTIPFIWLSITAILSHQPSLAITFTLLAFCVDILDGLVARRQNTSSKFGLILDTIIDTINYPVFCSLFAYIFLFNSSLLGSVVAIFILIFSVLRLARMAHQGIQYDHQSRPFYQGVVTPHVTLAIILLYLTNSYLLKIPNWTMALILIPLSILMISTARVYKPKSLKWVITTVATLLFISVVGYFNH